MLAVFQALSVESFDALRAGPGLAALTRQGPTPAGLHVASEVRSGIGRCAICHNWDDVLIGVAGVSASYWVVTGENDPRSEPLGELLTGGVSLGGDAGSGLGPACWMAPPDVRRLAGLAHSMSLDALRTRYLNYMAEIDDRVHRTTHFAMLPPTEAELKAVEQGFTEIVEIYDRAAEADQGLLRWMSTASDAEELR